RRGGPERAAATGGEGVSTGVGDGVAVPLAAHDASNANATIDALRKVHLETRSALAGRDGDLDPEPPRELPDDRETEPAPDRTIAAVLPPEVEPLEHVLRVLGVEARSLVRHDDHARRDLHANVPALR